MLKIFDDYFMELKMITIKKMLLIVAFAVPLQVVLKFVETYVYDDWSFLLSLLILIVVDTLTGFLKAFVKKNFESAKIIKIGIKIILYGIALITIHVLTHFHVSGEKQTLLQWFDDFALSLLMIREAVSIFENIAEIKPDLLPKAFLKYLKKFDDETGELKDGY